MKYVLAGLLCAAVLFGADPLRRAPGFSLLDAKGQEHDLADHRGKPVLLAFTQTTCPHCAGFADVLEKTHEKYGDKVAILAVVNPPDNPTTMMSFISGHNLTFPVLFDTGQMAYSYVLTTTMNFPRLYIIDAQGMIRRDYQYGPLTLGIFDGTKLAAEIDPLIGPAATQKK